MKYREEIMNDLYKQIGIKINNKKTQNNNNEALIYVLKVKTDSDIYKIGKTKNLKIDWNNTKLEIFKMTMN